MLNTAALNQQIIHSSGKDPSLSLRCKMFPRAAPVWCVWTFLRDFYDSLRSVSQARQLSRGRGAARERGRGRWGNDPVELISKTLFLEHDHQDVLIRSSHQQREEDMRSHWCLISIIGPGFTSVSLVVGAFFWQAGLQTVEESYGEWGERGVSGKCLITWSQPLTGQLYSPAGLTVCYVFTGRAEQSGPACSSQSWGDSRGRHCCPSRVTQTWRHSTTSWPGE